jgi:dienelactone hydrolase
MNRLLFERSLKSCASVALVTAICACSGSASTDPATSDGGSPPVILNVGDGSTPASGGSISSGQGGQVSFASGGSGNSSAASSRGGGRSGSAEAGSTSTGGSSQSADGSGGSPFSLPGQMGGRTNGGASSGTGGRRGTASGGASASGGRGGLFPTGGASSVGGSTSAGGGASSSGSPVLPAPTQTCAPFVTGKMSFLGIPASVWVGSPSADQHGPVLIYWHGTGSTGQEAQSAFGAAALAEIASEGGVVVAFDSSTKQGTNTGDAVWFTGDFALADEVVGCANQRLHIDPTRIHSAGYSAGGLQTAWMASAHAGYLASVVSFSGGVSSFGGATQPKATNVPAALVAHGAAGSDVFILDFAAASQKYEQQIRQAGGFAIDCDDGGSHIDVAKRFKVGPQGWEFLKAHPFKVSPEPYATLLPKDFPSYCKIVP